MIVAFIISLIYMTVSGLVLHEDLKHNRITAREAIKLSLLCLVFFAILFSPIFFH